MVRTAIAFLFGCLLIALLPGLPERAFWLGLIPLLAGLLLCRFFTVAVFVIALLFSGWHAQQRLDNRLNPALQRVDMTITGTIASVPEYLTDRVRFEFKPAQDLSELPDTLRLTWQTPPPEQQLHAGERWQFRVRLKKPYSLHNPGAFDYEGWLFQNRIGATGYIRPHPDNRQLAQPNAFSIDRWRQRVSSHLADVLADSPHMSLTQGLTVGLREAMTQEQWRVLRQTGTSHLLAISGLHIGLAASIGFFLVRWLWSLRSRLLLYLPAQIAGSIGGLAFALFYALLSGMSIPTQRALIMVCVVMLAILFRRKALSYQVLAAALICVLLVDPFAVLSTGMWLSFLAVVIIMFISQNRYPAVRWLGLRIHIWVSVALTPFLFLFFNETSLISPVANIIAVPVVSILVVPLLLLGVVLSGLQETWSFYPLKLADYILEWLWRILVVLADVKLATWQTASLPMGYLLLGMIGITLLMAPKGWPHKILGLLLFLPTLLYTPARPGQGDFWLTLLDVGQGLSAVVQTQHHTLIFDTGPRYGEFDTGQAVLVPYLTSRGIRHIDRLLISHGDNDHIGGADSLLSIYPARQLLTSDPALLPGSAACHAGQSWRWDGVLFEMLYPLPDSTGSTNDLSCVLKVEGAGGSLLLTGDIERAAEFSLVRHAGERLQADILVVPHHGSRTSSTETFIDRVQPEYALFAAGYLNTFGHPARQVVDRYQYRDIATLNSADLGALQFTIQAGAPIQYRSSRLTGRRLWTASPTD